MMSARSLAAGFVVATAALVAVPALAEPTIDQVYQAVESGHMAQAQQMMDEVLQAHPNSAKAHYVEAELLARQGNMGAAGEQLRTAERLEPGLPFARREAVNQLQQRISSGSGSAMAPAVSRSGVPWNGILLIGALVILAFIVIRALRARRAATASYGGPGGSGYGPRPVTPYGAPYGGAGVPQAGVPPAGGGIGSGIMGGLATGAALGAGMVAGEALAHRLGEGMHGNSGAAGSWGDDQARNDDMGGQDFGVSDGSSWDDSSSSADAGDWGAGGGDGGGNDWS